MGKNKVLGRPIDFNVTEYKKFIDTVSALLLNFIETTTPLHVHVIITKINIYLKRLFRYFSEAIMYMCMAGFFFVCFKETVFQNRLVQTDMRIQLSSVKTEIFKDVK